MQKILFFIFILVFFIGGNFLVFYRIYSFFPQNIFWRVIFFILGFFATFSFIFLFLWGDLLPLNGTILLSKFATSWIFIILYFVLLIIIQELLILLSKTNLPPSCFGRYVARDNIWATLTIIILLVLVFIGGYCNYNNKKRVQLNFSIDARDPDLNTNKSLIKKIRIVAISDLHLGYTIGQDELTKWVELINKEKPDIVLIAGDMIDNNLKSVDTPEMISELRKINAPDGIYACLGNHEYIATQKSKLNEVEAFYKKCNIHLLRDSIAEVDDSFYIIGRDDKTNKYRKSLEELVKNLEEGHSIIVLDHQPFNLEELPKNNIDIQLSGHTHQGQVWPLSLVTKFLYEKDHGLIEKDKSKIYVSSGLGIWGGKFRIGTNSEYVVMDIIQIN